ncbi:MULTISPECIES: hypothetical protein [Paraburkholderia]|uniref:hypothetical protein n=1 Tax=Paraburkholderia TaxID=1822464 RepID=UPI0013EB5840|nr:MULTISPECIES: hypothetical protein [Paraburkholderia]MDR8401790.1 hypothetical protein [Paraburkholderia sp. USG1]
MKVTPEGRYSDSSTDLIYILKTDAPRIVKSLAATIRVYAKRFTARRQENHTL